MMDPSLVRVSRRSFIEAATLWSGALLLPATAAWGEAGRHALSKAAREAIESSPLIYITPIRSDGSESTCHGEVWFAAEGGDLLVVTPRETWRARAVMAHGLDRARIWVGDFGVWKKPGSEFKSAPTFLAQVEQISSDAALAKRTLDALGAKYEKTGWEKWGPVFHKDLRNGDRVLLRYRPLGA